jgi:hypothetical protein
MTRNETRAAILIMEAYLDGYEIQRCGKHWNPKESLKPDWCDTDEPCWDFDNCDYRIKPTATLRPWTADEVPLGAQMRTGANGEYRWLIDCSGHNIKRKEWLEECEHSTDGGKTWLPCGVVEEAK